MKNKSIGVVAGILEQDDKFLLCQRPKGKVCENFWEFPGGKIEPSETPLQAIFRELKEELNIEIDCEKTYFWFSKEFIYSHAAVKLYFFRIQQWAGEINEITAEHQALSWQNISPANSDFFQPSVTPLLPANFPIIKALALPQIALICENSAENIISFLQKSAKNQKILIIFREKSTIIFSEKITKLQNFYQKLNALNLDWKNIIFSLNISAEQDWLLLSKIPKNIAIAAHLSSAYFSANINSLAEFKQKYDLLWLGVSTHNSKELEQIKQINQSNETQRQTSIVDYAFLSPIYQTKTHPEITPQSTLGIKNFKNLVENFASIPIFALGGLSIKKDFWDIKNAGGQGIATISGIF